MGKISDDISLKIAEYQNRAFVTRRSHYLASSIAERKNFLLGIPVVVITALVGTSIFGTLQDNPSVHIKIAAGVLSISATILAALQTYLGFSEKSAKHKEAGAKYAAIWRCLDLLNLELRSVGDDFANRAIEELKKIVATLDDAGKESPTVPDRAYKTAVTELRSKLASSRTSVQSSDATSLRAIDSIAATDN
jgi:hypothetical protein